MDVQKTFLVPFGVHQKELASRGETRPGGSQPHPYQSDASGQAMYD
jgi:hypothetical protein